MADLLKILIVDPQPDAVANLERLLNSFDTFVVVGDTARRTRQMHTSRVTLDIDTVVATHYCQLVRACHLRWPARCGHTWVRFCRCPGATPREELHQLIETLDDDQLTLALHAAVVTLAGVCRWATRGRARQLIS
jgi:hypothetical protein